MKEKPDFLIILIFVAGITPCVLLLIHGPFPNDGMRESVLIFLAAVLAILTGFLITTTTIFGDPRSVVGENWRVASIDRRATRRELKRFVVLLFAYVGTIFFSFLSFLLSIAEVDVKLRDWAVHIALCLGTTSLVWSLCLPLAIYKALMKRINLEVNSRRRPDSHERQALAVSS